MRKYIIISIAAMVLCACTKQAIQATYDKQETTIESLVENILKSDEAATVEYPGGVVRIRFSNSTSTESDPGLEKGGKVSFFYGGYTVTAAQLSKSNLFATNLQEIATDSGWNNADESMFAEETVTVGEGELVPGLERGLLGDKEKGIEGVKKGDEYLIVFSGKYGWGNHARGTIPARSALAYHIWVTGISNE